MALLKYKLAFSIFLIWLFHISGIIGILLGHEKWFVSLSYLNLTICFAVIVLNSIPLSRAQIFGFSATFLVGFVAELLGVNYGLIFGNYEYGNNLGFKLMGVPIMIGINWITLVYCSSGISKQFFKNIYLSAFVASLLMVLLDFFMEKSAPRFDYWMFESNSVPIQNYIGWLGVGFLAQLIFQSYFNKQSTSLSWHLYFVILLFFVTVYFYCINYFNL
jgi:putative membrane protein